MHEIYAYIHILTKKFISIYLSLYMNNVSPRLVEIISYIHVFMKIYIYICQALPKLVETISLAHSINPSINFEVFLHKVDGDFMSEEGINVNMYEYLDRYI